MRKAVVYQITFIVISILTWSNLSAQCSFTIDLTEDFSICEPQNVDLSAIVDPNPLIFQWSDDSGIVSTDLNTTIFVDETTTFTFSAFANTTNNLVFNGDFEMGNVGFTSEYLLGDVFCPFPQGPLWCEGMYTVSDDPANTHQNFNSCDDHTTGFGQMLIANGSNTFINVWCQDITVIPNTNYQFSAWAASVETGSPAILQFTINGNAIGENFDVDSSPCIWGNFTAIWNSGSSTTATICIENQNLSTGGNDFALDDIEFIETCENSETVTVTISEVIGSLESSHTLDCDNPLVDLSVTPEIAGYSYAWGTQFGAEILGSTDLSTAIATSTGLYTVTITDENGCTESLVTSVNGSTDLPETDVIGDFILDCDSESAVVFSTNSASNLTYEWENNSSFGPIADYNEAGNYTLTVTNQFNCSFEVDFSIFELVPETEVLGDFIMECDEESTMVFSSLDGSDLIFEWENNTSTESTATYEDPGNYTLTVTNEFNCSTEVDFSIFQFNGDLDYDLEVSDTLSCIGDETNIIYTSQDDHSLQWFDPEGNPLGSTDTISVNDIGIYIIEITADDGCSAIDSVNVISQISTLNYTLGESPVITCNEPQATLSVEVNSPFSNISWFGPNLISTADTALIDSAGEYIIEILDENGCLTRDTINVMDNFTAPFFDLGTMNIDCESGMGSVFTISDSSYNVSWELPDGSLITGDTVSSNQEGEYIVIATNSIGCVTIDTIELQATQDFPSISVGFSDINCSSPTAQIDLQSSIPGTMFSWVGPNGFSSNESSFMIDVEGHYIYEATSPLGCKVTDTLVVQGDFAMPNLILTALDTFDCNTNEIEIIASSNSSFTFGMLPGNTVSVEDSSIFVSLSDNISVEIIGDNGCEGTAEINLEMDFEKPNPPTIEDITLDCNTLEVTLEAETNPDYIYTWNDGMTDITAQSFSVDETGIYSLQVVNSQNGCDSITTFEVFEDVIAVMPEITNSHINCINETAVISISSTQEINSIASSSDVIEIPDLSFETQSAGLKQFTVTYSNGCTAETSALVEIDTVSPVLSSIDYTFACQKTALAIQVEHDVEFPSFLWEAPDSYMITDEIFFTAIAGTYHITVTNTENGCSSTEEVNVFENSTHIQSEIDIMQAQCFGDVPEINLINSGGTLPYSFVIFNQDGVEVPADNLQAGLYNIEVVDYLGCDTSYTFTIDEVLPFTIDAGQSITLSKGTEANLLATTDLIESDILQIDWMPDAFLSCDNCLNPIVSGLEEDTWFTVDIIDNNGCIETDSILVRVVSDYSIYVPNTFSPDEDGRNDVFEIFGNSASSEIFISEFRIYDRWGNKVHEEFDFNINNGGRWQGTHNDKPAIQGVYAYYFKALFPEGNEEVFSGTITLLR